MRRKEAKRRIRELTALAKDRGIEFTCIQCGIKPQHIFLNQDGTFCVSCVNNPIPSDLLESAWMAYALVGFGGCYEEPF